MTPAAHLITRVLSAWLLAVFSTSVTAHDTWFARLPPGKAGRATLALGTGNRFPVHEFNVSANSLQQHGCRDQSSDTFAALHPLRETPKALIVRTPTVGSSGLSCWAQQQPFDVEISAPVVETYFREINAPQGVRAAWAEMRARGVAWKERFSKHARIELLPRRGTAAQPPRATGMAMDVLLESGLKPVHPGDTLSFQVLRDGQPLPGLAVELHSDQSPIGFWKQTDAQGRVSFQPPLAGKWVLRGTDLRVSATAPDTWESRFVTLAFEVTSP